jgi:Domain of unknown function (DUF1844)
MAPQDSQEEQADKGFTISDKRLFTKEGARRTPPSAAETPAAGPPPPPRQEAPPPEAPRPPHPEAGEIPRHDMPPADFATFVAMLANNIMLFLGQIPDPVTRQRRRDLPQAKHTIDILVMLRDKTRGNLTADETQLLQELLPQLQMAYVAASRQGG